MSQFAIDRGASPGEWSLRPASLLSQTRAAFDRVALYCSVLIFGSYLFPAEAAIRVGLVWTMRRVAIAVCLAPLAIALVNKIRSRRYIFVLSDLLVLGFAFWAPLALYWNGGLQAVASVNGLVGFELAIPYFIGRILLGDPRRLELIGPVVFGFVIGLLLVGMLDLLARENIVARVATQIFGNFRSVKFYGSQEVLAYTTQFRFGLPRVRGPIEHSILYGTFFAALIPVLQASLRSASARVLALGLCGLGVLFSLSSAPILLLGIAIGVIAYDQLFRNVRWRWAFLVMMILLLLAAILLIVDDPVLAFVRGFTLDPATGITRMQIWYWVGHNLGISPIFGVGARDWFRPTDMLSSIDAMWLVIALQYGFVGLALLLGTVFGCFITVRRQPLQRHHDPRLQLARQSLTLTIVLLLLSSLTVHFWGAIWGLFGLMLGIRAGLSEATYLPREREP